MRKKPFFLWGGALFGRTVLGLLYNGTVYFQLHTLYMLLLKNEHNFIQSYRSMSENDTKVSGSESL